MNPHSAISEQAAARRLVQRVGLGPRPGELAAAGFEATLAALIETGSQPDPGAAATPAPTFAPEARVRKSAGRAARRAQRQELAGQAHQLGVWWLDR
ncbi:MAG: hypothetical protein QOC67_3525, partial [Pseudonocardiales bacterium]|nr:hypothetical protein [Pseudonocardiales bacterium]